MTARSTALPWSVNRFSILPSRQAARARSGASAFHPPHMAYLARYRRRGHSSKSARAEMDQEKVLIRSAILYIRNISVASTVGYKLLAHGNQFHSDNSTLSYFIFNSIAFMPCVGAEHAIPRHSTAGSPLPDRNVPDRSRRRAIPE